jgi:hypothetical protein
VHGLVVLDAKADRGFSCFAFISKMNSVKHVGFEVLTAVSMKIAVFWVVAQTTRCYNPEDSNLQFTTLLITDLLKQNKQTNKHSGIIYPLYQLSVN